MTGFVTRSTWFTQSHSCTASHPESVAIAAATPAVMSTTNAAPANGRSGANSAKLRRAAA